jgi:hypothetical protein
MNMKLEKITSYNWDKSSFESQSLSCFLTYGAEPTQGQVDNLSDISELYSITLTDKEGKEIMQWDYATLELALEDINKKYSHWEFKDSTLPEPPSSCGKIQ